MKESNDEQKKIAHDVLACISALKGAIELIEDEWRNTPELAINLLNLSDGKVKELKNEIEKYHRSYNK